VPLLSPPGQLAHRHESNADLVADQVRG
jgi:hypothetical protein